MMNHTFTIPGHPCGYYAQGARPNWKRMKAYRDWKQKVQLYAAAAGLVLPLRATKDAPVFVGTVAYFRNGVHCDPGNVQKGICDALFYGAKGSGDKFTGGSFPAPRYDAKNPRVLVTVQSLWPTWGNLAREMARGAE